MLIEAIEQEPCSLSDGSVESHSRLSQILDTLSLGMGCHTHEWYQKINWMKIGIIRVFWRKSDKRRKQEAIYYFQSNYTERLKKKERRNLSLNATSLTRKIGTTNRIGLIFASFTEHENAPLKFPASHVGYGISPVQSVSKFGGPETTRGKGFLDAQGSADCQFKKWK